MQKVLTQEQIDAMVRAARGADETNAANTDANVTAWDATKAGQIGKDQVRAISRMHENFARNLTNSVGAYLRVVFEASLVSAEHLPYQEFLQSCPDVSYLASFRLVPLAATAVLQLDLGAAYPIVELMLGGEGKGTAPTRETTAIEEQILESVVRIILRELQISWQQLSLEFVFEQRQRPDQVQRLMRPEEKVLCLTFEIHVAETRGSLNLAIPAVVSNALLRKMSADWTYQRPQGPSTGKGTLHDRLLECPFQFDLEVTAIPVRAREVMRLTPGDLLLLPRPISSTALALVNGEPMFAASIGRNGTRRVAQVLDPVEIVDREEKSRD